MRTLLLLALLLGAVRAEEGAPVEAKVPLHERINKAIDSGVQWLKNRQAKDGSYGPCVSGGTYGGDGPGGDCYRIGPTAFAAFTLRKCGVPRKDKTIKLALKWLKKHCRVGWHPDLGRTSRESQFQAKGAYRYTSYESAAIIMMLAMLNKKDLPRGRKAKPVKMSRKPTTPAAGWKRDEWKWMHDRVQSLIKSPHPRMPHVQMQGGGWRYWPRYRKDDQDLSATQFALLGLRAAVGGGYPVNLVQPKTWKWAAMCAQELQDRNGAFHYQAKEPWTAGMTAAGIASLLICKEQIANAGETPPTWIDERVKSGLVALGKTLNFAKNTTGKGKREVRPVPLLPPLRHRARRCSVGEAGDRRQGVVPAWRAVARRSADGRRALGRQHLHGTEGTCSAHASPCSS